ncbi:MAG: hypothetical protein JJ992_23740, partial [Planctomycetes bacterium]|nr:hypothetical protein [Planctomycetota bacterium]
MLWPKAGQVRAWALSAVTMLAWLAPSSVYAARALEQAEQLVAASLRGDVEQAELHEAVTEWDRQRAPNQEQPDDGLQIKYMLSHWREITQKRLVAMAEQAADTESFGAAIEGLDRLQRVLEPRDIQRLWMSFKKIGLRGDSRSTEQMAMVLANHGDPRAVHRVLKRLGHAAAHRRAGPRAMPGVVPILPHALWRTGRRGIRGAKMADYDIDDLALHYRGLQLRPGDMLLVDSTNRADGLFNSFSQPRSHFTHCAMVAFVDHPKTGKRVPVAFEVHMGGLRVIPLHRYLSPSFSAYAEVYRPALGGFIGCMWPLGTVDYRLDALLGLGSIRHHFLP